MSKLTWCVLCTPHMQFRITKSAWWFHHTHGDTMILEYSRILLQIIESVLPLIDYPLSTFKQCRGSKKSHGMGALEYWSCMAIVMTVVWAQIMDTISWNTVTRIWVTSARSSRLLKASIKVQIISPTPHSYSGPDPIRVSTLVFGRCGCNFP